MARLGIGLGLGFRSGQSQCVSLFRSVNYHILVKSEARRSRSVLVSRAEVTGRLSLPNATSAHAREIVGSFGPQ